jgi:hypothetical protein
METRFPTHDTVRAALIALLEANGCKGAQDCVEVAVLTNGALPAYRVTPATAAASTLAAEITSITGRALTPEASWVLQQSDVNLLFGAVRERSASSSNASH